MSITKHQLKALRADTPACKALIHFNNAGAAISPTPVLNAVTSHLQLEANIGGYEASDQAQAQLDQFYTNFAILLNADQSEIAYVENATRAWDMAFYAIPFKSGDQIITHESEYISSHLAFLQMAKRRGVEIILAPSDSSGQINTAAVANLITDKTKLLALAHIPTQGGLINPAAELGKIAKQHNILYLLDACQSAGQLDLDVKKLNCDILTGTGRKFLRGPRGTGFLYISNKIIDQLDPPFIDSRAASWDAADRFTLAPGARRFETWESYIAGKIGLSTAVKYALDIGMPAIEQRIISLAALLRENLSSLKGVTVHDQGRQKGGLVTFRKQDIEVRELSRQLRQQQINISVSPVTSARIDFTSRGIESLGRASLHYYNTEGEIEQFCNAVDQIK